MPSGWFFTTGLMPESDWNRPVQCPGHVCGPDDPRGQTAWANRSAAEAVCRVVWDPGANHSRGPDAALYCSMCPLRCSMRQHENKNDNDNGKNCGCTIATKGQSPLGDWLVQKISCDGS